MTRLEQFKEKIENKKRKFKIFAIFSLIMVALASPLIIYYFFINPNHFFVGIICFTLAIIFSFLNISYINSRDKMEIIDYFSLRYYIEYEFSIKKILKFIKKHLFTFIIYGTVIILFQGFWILSITLDIYSFTAMPFFWAIVKSPWEYQFHTILHDSVDQSEESDTIIRSTLKRIDQLTFTEKNKIEFVHLKKLMKREARVKSSHTQLIKRTTIQYNIKFYIAETILFESFGIISWWVMNFWLVSINLI